MALTDTLHRFLFDTAPVRGELAQLHNSYKTIVHQHPYPPALRRLLGEALVVAALLSAIIKFDGRLTVQFRGKGKLRLLLAQCDNHFNMRGLAKWDGDLSYDDLMAAFHDGVLAIMLDSGVNTNRYQGVVAWQGNSFVESIENYFRQSEQLATKIWLKVTDDNAAGFLLQVVPGQDSTNTELDPDAQGEWERVIKLTQAKLDQDDLTEVDPELFLPTLYPDDAIRIFPEVELRFQCACSRKRGEDAILILGREEAAEELASKQMIKVTCDFCNQEYVYSKEDVDALFEAENKSPPPSSLH